MNIVYRGYCQAAQLYSRDHPFWYKLMPMDALRKQFEIQSPFEYENVRGVICKDSIFNDNIYIFICGSDDDKNPRALLGDWVYNLWFFKKPLPWNQKYKGHAGAAACLMKIADIVEEYISIESKVHIFGHSHGGGIAIFMADYLTERIPSIEVNLYPFGALKVAGQRFHRQLAAKCKLIYETLFGWDIVGFLPPFPGYKHTLGLKKYGRKFLHFFTPWKWFLDHCPVNYIRMEKYQHKDLANASAGSP